MKKLLRFIGLGIIFIPVCAAHWVVEQVEVTHTPRHVWYDDLPEAQAQAQGQVLDSEEEGEGGMEMDVPPSPIKGLPSALMVEVYPSFGVMREQVVLSGVTRQNVHLLKELTLVLPANYAVTVEGNFWPLDTPLVNGAEWVTLAMKQVGILDVSGLPQHDISLKQLTLRFVGDARPEVRRTLLEFMTARGHILSTFLVVTPVWTLREHLYGHGREFLLFNTIEEFLCRDWEEMGALGAWRRAEQALETLLDKRKCTKLELSATLAAIERAKAACVAVRDQLRGDSIGFQWDLEIRAAEYAAFMLSQSQEELPGFVTAMQGVVLPHTLLMQRESTRSPDHHNDGAA